MKVKVSMCWLCPSSSLTKINKFSKTQRAEEEEIVEDNRILLQKFIYGCRS